MASIHKDTPESGRRKGDRRQAQVVFEGVDRRKGDRRSGTDRRAMKRRSGSDRRA
jgi:hypothetical protein